MDYGILNAIGITLMAVFGLWAFQKGLSGGKKPERPDKGKEK